MEKKFQLPKTVMVGEKLEAIEVEINRLYEAIASLTATRRRVVSPETSKCSQWCAYQGYDEHLPNCSRKGPVE